MNVTGDSVDQTIENVERGNYTVAVRNNSSTTLSVSGFARYWISWRKALKTLDERMKNNEKTAFDYLYSSDADISAHYSGTCGRMQVRTRI